MNVDTSFIRRRREQQIKFERSVLRELSLETLKKGFHAHFGTITSNGSMMLDSAIQEGCYDIAVEAFLSGSRYSRLGYYGESLESVKDKSFVERDQLAQALAEFITYWSHIGVEHVQDERLAAKCQQYINYWWEEGFTKGKIKYKMKMH